MKSRIMLSLLIIIAVSMFASAVSAADVLTVSLVNQDPDPAIAGDILEVRIGVENTEGIVSENAVLELEDQYPFSMVPGESAVKKIGTLGSYQTGDNYKIIKFRINVDRDAPAGTYDLVFWQYQEGQKEAAGIRKTVSVDVKGKEGAEVIYIDKTDLVPGIQTDMKFVITNLGSAPLKDLSFSWENADSIILPVGSDNTKYIKYIDVEESAELDYKVVADSNAEPGLYKLDLALKYEDPLTGEDEEISTIAGVYVGGETDFDVAFSESSSGETSFSIANIGSNPAFSVSVIIPAQDGWRVSGSNSVIIGNLNKGDYTVASFALQQGGGAGMMPPSVDFTQMSDEERQQLREQRTSQSKQTVIVEIAYTDTKGSRKIIEKEVAINPSAMMSSTVSADGTTTTIRNGFRGRMTQQTSFWSQYKWYIIGIAAVVVLLFLYKKYKRKKLENPKFKLGSLFKRKK
ncbi:COG1361 S-layer family protein [Candidatus Woesearchaeota archaeon]|nr:COG1361 S-layer family protein [Candidatus Woesearchaeota archaeon]MBW3005812.1 COG1361 S-layer family protein [Candidatus Woesearchaeota archaeon]